MCLHSAYAYYREASFLRNPIYIKKRRPRKLPGEDLV
jgi:hypothetical protein